jgi:predicted nucleic acid-binding Zn ribbon protein
MEKKCISCGMPVEGRIDKKFCSDYCRTDFNNERVRALNSRLENRINRILRGNRRILLQVLGGSRSSTHVTRDALMMEGFVFQYYTHFMIEECGRTYYWYDCALCVPDSIAEKRYTLSLVQIDQF